MKKIFKALLPLALGSLALGACSVVPNEAYFNRGTPESLLDVSSEVINVGLTSDRSVDEITDWINRDQPTRAELYCMDGDPICAGAQQVLEQFGVPVHYVAAADNNVALIYERVLARDCENRFINNTVNPYNFNHPTFGCSVASNMVQMVSDKRQFVSPALLDYADGRKAAQTYGRYLEPPPETQNQNRDSLLDQVRGGQR